MTLRRVGPYGFRQTVTRAELRKQIPGWYRWWHHAGLVAAFCLGGIALCLSQLDSPGLGDALLFVAMLLVANLGEWAVHIRSLHRPVFPYAPFERHTQHHAFFGFETMAVDRLADMYWVIFPPWALPLMAVSLLPLFGLFALFSWNAAWVFLLAVFVYYGVYEIFHSLAHLPGTHPAAGIPWVRAITHHHRVHHDPRLMKRWNFNFAMPIFDRLFGTLYPSPSRAARDLPEGGVAPAPLVEEGAEEIVRAR
ncbi:MAG: sterol desaturase family protein [Candidatus Binatia bacterium]